MLILFNYLLQLDNRIIAALSKILKIINFRELLYNRKINNGERSNYAQEKKFYQ